MCTYVLTNKPKLKRYRYPLWPNWWHLLGLLCFFLWWMTWLRHRIDCIKIIFGVIPAEFTSIFVRIPPFKQRISNRQTVNNLWISEVKITFCSFPWLDRLVLSCIDLWLNCELDQTVWFLEVNHVNVLNDHGLILRVCIYEFLGRKLWLFDLI